MGDCGGNAAGGAAGSEAGGDWLPRGGEAAAAPERGGTVPVPAASFPDAPVAPPSNAPPSNARPTALARARARLTDLRALAARAAARAATGAVDGLLPPACVACTGATGAHGGLCPTCWRGVRWIERPYCEVTGAPMAVDLGPGALSPLAIAMRPPYGRARAAAMFDAVPRRLVHRLKYEDDTGLAPWMARWMARAGHALLSDADMVVPVPLHRARQAARRFNQSAELARRVAALAGLPHRPDALRRVRATARQVGMGRTARQRNVAGAFAVPEGVGRGASLDGARVVLVDDVLTTGATVASATRALLRGGAGSVDVLTFARVDHGDDGLAFAAMADALDDAWGGAWEDEWDVIDGR